MCDDLVRISGRVARQRRTHGWDRGRWVLCPPCLGHWVIFRLIDRQCSISVGSIQRAILTVFLIRDAESCQLKVGSLNRPCRCEGLIVIYRYRHVNLTSSTLQTRCSASVLCVWNCTCHVYFIAAMLSAGVTDKYYPKFALHLLVSTTWIICQLGSLYKRGRDSH